MVPLTPNSIHLVDIDNTTTLFFHTDTLQIYPLKKDSEILSFLQRFQCNGEHIKGVDYAFEDYERLYQFVCDKISTAPLSGGVEVSTEQYFFDCVVLPIAAQCNLSCPYCFAYTDDGFHFENYTEEYIIHTLDFLVKQKSDEQESINIVFFGGEPLLRLDIMKFTIQYAKQHYPTRKFAYSITTNGTILNEEIIDLLKTNNIAVLLSVDGPDNEFNLRRYHNGTKSIGRVLDNIRKMKESGINIELRATMVNTNPYVLETFLFFEKLEIPFDVVFAYVSENQSHHYADYDKNTLQHIQSQLDDLLQYYVDLIRHKKTIYNSILTHFAKVFHYRFKQSIPCSAGHTYFTIMSNGNVYTCPHFMNDDKYIVGNINSKDIIDSVRRKQLMPFPIEEVQDCKDCWAHNLCLGGCIGQKLSVNRSNTSSLGYESCQLQQIQWDFYLKLYYYIQTMAPEYLRTINNGSMVPI